MKRLYSLLLFAFTLLLLNTNAQDVTTVEAKSTDISENLDLEAIASVFGESKDLEEFENKLNDPELQISNLDLNEDGEVDYLRVVETSEKNTHLIAIQAVIGKDQFQDVATVEVEKDDNGETTVQVVGDVYMYGSNCIVQPVYHHPPVIISFFWGPYYRPWHSPWYWGYYPPYYHPWRPYPTPYYRSNVHVHINVNNTYRRTNVRYSSRSVNMQKQVRRNDYARTQPNNSFEKRNKGVTNKNELIKNRPTNSNNRPAQTKPSQKPVQTKPSQRPTQTKPAQKPTQTKPAQKPVQTKPAQKPVQTKPAQKPVQTKPAQKPTQTKPAQRPTNAKPAQRPAQSKPTRNNARPARRGGGGRR